LSQLFITHQTKGNAISAARTTSFKKSFESIITTLLTDAPTTLRMPISFCLLCAVNAARPNKPKHEMRIARPAKYFDKTATRLSEVYNA
jgi:hypothetical protein